MSFYSDPETEAIYGANLEASLPLGVKLTIEDLYYVENLFTARLAKVHEGFGVGYVDYRQYGSTPEEAGLTFVSSYFERMDLTAAVRYRMADGKEDEVYDYDFTADNEDEVGALFLPPLSPFVDYSLSVRSAVTEYLGLGARVKRHNLIDESDEDGYNVDYNEGALSLDLTGWPFEGFSFDAEVSRWYEERERTDLDEDSSWDYGVRLAQAIRDHEVGVEASRQSYDGDGASRDATRYGAWAKIKISSPADFTFRVERETNDLYEDEDIDALTTVSARLDLAF